MRPGAIQASLTPPTSRSSPRSTVSPSFDLPAPRVRRWSGADTWCPRPRPAPRHLPSASDHRPHYLENEVCGTSGAAGIIFAASADATAPAHTWFLVGGAGTVKREGQDAQGATTMLPCPPRRAQARDIGCVGRLAAHARAASAVGRSPAAIDVGQRRRRAGPAAAGRRNRPPRGRSRAAARPGPAAARPGPWP